MTDADDLVDDAGNVNDAGDDDDEDDDNDAYVLGWLVSLIMSSVKRVVLTWS